MTNEDCDKGVRVDMTNEDCDKCHGLGMYKAWWNMTKRKFVAEYEDQEDMVLKLMQICNCKDGRYCTLISKPIHTPQEEAEIASLQSPW